MRGCFILKERTDDLYLLLTHLYLLKLFQLVSLYPVCEENDAFVTVNSKLINFEKVYEVTPSQFEFGPFDPLDAHSIVLLF